MKSIIVANWKMNPATMREGKRLLAATKKAADGAKHANVIVAPPSIFLRELRATYKGKKISFAAQNAHAEKSGAYTGEISFAQVKDACVSYVIIGHAERRAMGESNDDTRKKVAAALAIDMVPILCVGEASRSGSGEHFNFVKEQLRAGLADVLPQKLSKIIVAYEPVWAIGAVKPMSPRDMHEMAIFIRKAVVDLKGELGMAIKILYGGSIDEKTAPSMLRDGDVIGLLVGRASEDAAKFSALLQAIEQTA
jgi:triosephosphate isomerase